MATFCLLLGDERGTVLVKYSSLALLIAIAAIAVLGQADSHLLD
jgi:Flp pilus assembly pilin Flp